MENRRKDFELVAEKCGFMLSKPKKKADEYEHENIPHATIYFYWEQGKEELNLAINPRVTYENLLGLRGVSLKKTNQPNGIRFGSTMKTFPADHEELRPEDPQSRVGRMFSIQKSELSEFLKHLVLNIRPGFSSTSQNESHSGNRDSRENNKDGKNSSEKAPSDLNEALQLAVKGIEGEYKNKPGEDVDAIVKRRVGQSEFRDVLVEIYGAACHVSDLAKGRLLIASHIVPWSKSSGEEKTDPDNGLLLAVNWDAVFDKGFISFDAKGEVMFSDELDDETSTRLGLDRNARLKNGTLTPKRLEYLKRHREEIFKGGKKAN